MVEQMKSESQKTIETSATPETSLPLRLMQIRLPIIAWCCGFILHNLQVWQSHAAGERIPIIYITLASFNCLLHLFFIFPVYRNAKRLDNSGTLAYTALRKKYQTQVHTNIRSRSRDINFFFLEYELPQEVTMKIAVSEDLFETVSEGDRLRVLYLKESPTIQRVKQRI